VPNLQTSVSFRKKIVVSALTVLLLALFLPQIGSPKVAGQSSSTQCNSGNTFNWTLVGTPTSLNPLTFITGTGYVWLLEYPGATDYLWNGSQVSYMLSGWSHNANYTEWIFNIKPGLKWSNGEPVNSTDFLTSEGPHFAFNLTYNFEGLAQQVIKEQALNSSAAEYWLNTTNAHMIDEMSLDGQGGTPVLPASVIDQYGAAYPNLGTDVSMGPFYVSNYTVSSTQMVMLRNPYFTPQPNICEIQVSFVDTLSLTSERLQAGLADLAPIDPSTAASILKTPNLHVLDEKAVGAASLEYNDSVYPYNMTQFREALVYGINQTQFIQQAYGGYGVTAYNAETATPSSAGIWYNPNTIAYSYNPTNATALLNSIGITKGSDGYLHYPNGTDASLTLWTDTDNTEDLAGGSVVQSALQGLGFKVNLITTTIADIAGDYSANTNNIRNQIILFSGYVLNPPHPLVDVLPACSVEWLPPQCSHHFLWPPSADAEYQSNYSAFLATASQSQEQKYAYNIQWLESEYLPSTILAYPDFLWGYSTAHWTNWPNPVTGHMDEGLAEVPNMTAWETLAPVTSTTSAISTPTTPSTTTSSLTTATGSSSTSTPSSSSTYLYIAVAVVVIVVVAGGVLALTRRSKKT
jgi:ABC-type transport system substrate-binding protein